MQPETSPFAPRSIFAGEQELFLKFLETVFVSATNIDLQPSVNSMHSGRSALNNSNCYKKKLIKSAGS